MSVKSELWSLCLMAGWCIDFPGGRDREVIVCQEPLIVAAAPVADKSSAVATYDTPPVPLALPTRRAGRLSSRPGRRARQETALVIQNPKTRPEFARNNPMFFEWSALG